MAILKDSSKQSRLIYGIVKNSQDYFSVNRNMDKLLKLDDLAKSREMLAPVIPAKAGSQ
jgi:hypothetical protein